MIRRIVHLNVKGRPWTVAFFLPVTGVHVQEILYTLRMIGCSEENLATAQTNLMSGQFNNGLTFSNDRVSVCVWAVATSPPQYLNLIVHELHHLSVHIAKENGMDLEDEEVCYINGDMAMQLYDLIEPLVRNRDLNIF
jgi:hypothetical protein